VFKQGGNPEPRLSDDQIRETDGPTIQFESHAVTHRPLRGMPEPEMHRELAESKRELERMLSREVAYLAIPGNWYDRKVMRLARQVGYKGVWCSRPGGTYAGDSLYGLPRVNVEGCGDLQRFMQALTPFGLAQRRFVSLIKSAPARTLGPRAWLPIRTVIMRCVPGQFLSFARWRFFLIGLAVIVIGLILLAWVLR
jgi:peptidoglycan/xylan/chitin deacetylase (PgdA/CDA1 family)